MLWATGKNTDSYFEATVLAGLVRTMTKEIKKTEGGNEKQTTWLLDCGCGHVSILGCDVAFGQGTGGMAGTVQGAGKPIAGATVTLFAAGTGAPTKLAEGKTDDQGAFKLNAKQASKDSVLYLVAKGGTPKASANKGVTDAIALLAVLGATPPKTVPINELTTVASAFTSARFINGESFLAPRAGAEARA